MTASKKNYESCRVIIPLGFLFLAKLSFPQTADKLIPEIQKLVHFSSNPEKLADSELVFQVVAKHKENSASYGFIIVRSDNHKLSFVHFKSLIEIFD